MAEQSQEPTSLRNDDVHSRLYEFGYYFVDSFEAQLLFFRNILEERPCATSKSASLPVTVTSGLASAIPTFGKPLSIGIQQGEKFLAKKTDKRRAVTMAEIVYLHADMRETVRDVLFRGIFDLFRCFEAQFMRVNANGGRTRAMQKLATDASHRLLMYLLLGENYSLTPDLVTQGVLLGESQRHKLGIIKSGRSLMLEGADETVTTSDLYGKVGLRIKSEGGWKYYRIKKTTMTELIGHRLLFEWENPADIESTWIVDDDNNTPPSNHAEYNNLRAEDKENEVERLRAYVASRYPLEDLKESNRLAFEEQKRLHAEASSERREAQSQIVEDNRAKHAQTIKVVDQVQSAILETLKTNQQEILKHTEEKIGEVNENVDEKHAEVVQDLVVIRGELVETQGSISATGEKLSRENQELKQEVSVLKEHKEDLDNNIVLKINRNEVKKIEETLMQLDPVKAITNSGEYQKLRERFKF